MTSWSCARPASRAEQARALVEAILATARAAVASRQDQDRAPRHEAPRASTSWGSIIGCVESWKWRGRWYLQQVAVPTGDGLDPRQDP